MGGCPGTLGVLYVALMTHRYWTWERITLAAAMFNLIFVPVALLAHPQWHSIGQALVTWTPLPGGLNQDMLLIVLADIGATVTPWMLFFQQSATADKGLTAATSASAVRILYWEHPWRRSPRLQP